MDGSGNGCTTVFSRPSWQIGVGAATCSGRAEPDVAADADPATGAYVFYGGPPAGRRHEPLGAALGRNDRDLERGAPQVGGPAVGLVTPSLYSIGNNPSVYHSDFHDVTSGSAGGQPRRDGLGRGHRLGLSEPRQSRRAVHEPNPDDDDARRVVEPGRRRPLGRLHGDGLAHAGERNRRVPPGRGDIGGCSSVAPASGVAHCTVPLNHPGSFRAWRPTPATRPLQEASNTIFERVTSPPPPPPGGERVLDGRVDRRRLRVRREVGRQRATSGVTHLEPTPSRHGYWIVNRAGQVFAFGDAPKLGNASGLGAGETVSSLSSTPSGHGYWLFTSRGRALRFGDAQFFGDLSGTR